MSAVIVFDSSEAKCTDSIHNEIWKYLTLTQFHTYHFLEIQIVGVGMSCITRNFVKRFRLQQFSESEETHPVSRLDPVGLRFLIALQKIW